jgi:hypothetical protein
MALQLTGAFKKGSLANLQVLLPAVVIGGGLTAIDTATELAAYYPIQVEKLLERHEKLCESGGEEMVFSVLDPEERHLYAEALEHGRAVRAERERVAGTSEAPDFSRLVKEWGGSPSHHRSAERLSGVSPEPRGSDQGAGGDLLRRGCHRPCRTYPAPCNREVLQPRGGEVTLPARTVCVAAGPAQHHRGRRRRGTSGSIRPRLVPRSHRWRTESWFPAEVTGDLSVRGVLPSYSGGRHVSFFGDNHPSARAAWSRRWRRRKEGIPRIARASRGSWRGRRQRQPVWTT